MLEKRKEYIDRLLDELKTLESRVLTIKNEDTVPFSFFRESFDKTQAITRLLHEMEILQVDDMKQQMERLVSFLSESTSRKNEEEKAVPAETVMAVSEKIVEVPPQQNEYTRKFVLPEYKNPRQAENTPLQHPAEEPVAVREQPVEEKPPARSLNDTVQIPPATLDLKRGISLNDRFLFQRELFNNSRSEMNGTIAKLNSFGNYDDAERFLRETTSWDFENQTVMSFLAVIRKGF